jgi:hypothetical protein
MTPVPSDRGKVCLVYSRIEFVGVLNSKKWKKDEVQDEFHALIDIRMGMLEKR